MSPSRLTEGYVIAIAAAAMWSMTGVLISYLITNYGMPALLLAFWRNVLVCVALVPVLLLVRRSSLHVGVSQIRFYAFYGLVLALFNSVWTLSVQGDGAAAATVLGYTSVGFTAVLAFWLFKETLGLPKVSAIALSLVGCVMVSNAYSAETWSSNLLGVLTGLISGVFFAGYTLMGKEASRRKLNPWASVAYSFAFGALFVMCFNLFPFLPGAAGSYEALLPPLPVSGWLVLAALAFIPTMLGYVLYTVSLGYLPASTVSLLATSEPAMTAVEAYVFLGERLSVIQVVGSLAILFAVVIIRLRREETA